jgi:hypothetical protein
MSDRLLAQKEIMGGIHGECTKQSLREKHAWCIRHDVAVGIVGRYDVRAIKWTTARVTFPLFFVFQRVGFHATKFSSC